MILEEEIVNKIKQCKTTAELNEMRMDVVNAINGGCDFDVLQKTFRTQKNKLRRAGK